MKTLTRDELTYLERLFQLNQQNLLKTLRRFLEKKYSRDKIIYKDEYLIAVGDIPVGLVAHVDTVFPHAPQDIYYDSIKNVLWSPQGLGADDRAGVYAIINIVNSGFRPTIIFTTDEEKGCLGAADLIDDLTKAPTDLKYLIQLDRRGSNDCVFYQCANEAFEEYVESFGFATNFGTFSDISVICPEWKIAGVNLSVGYYNEHDYNEHLHLNQLFTTIKRVKNMLSDIENANYFSYIPDKFYAGIMKKYLMSDEASAFWGDFYKNEPAIHRCKCCQEADYDFNFYPVFNCDTNETESYCVDCMAQSTDIYWCDECGKAFKNKAISNQEHKEVLCNDCLIKKENKVVEAKNGNNGTN